MWFVSIFWLQLLAVFTFFEFFGVLTLPVDQLARVSGWLLFSLSVFVFFSIQAPPAF